MNTIPLNRTWISGQPVQVDNLTGTAFTGEAGAHTFIIAGKDVYGNDVPITGEITAKFLASNQVTVPLVGSIGNDSAFITLSDTCYLVPGRFVLSIFATNGNYTTCIYCGVGNVFATSSDIVAYPTMATPDLNQLIRDVQAAISSVPADYSALINSIASNFDPQKTGGYGIGEYVWYNAVLYRFKEPHTGGWQASHVDQVILANDLTSVAAVASAGVRYDIGQGLSDTQKATARANINAQETLTIDAAPTEGSTNPVQSGGVYSEVSALKSAIGMIETPQIVGMEETGKISVSSNLFQYAELVGEGKTIYSIANGKVVLQDSESYNTYLIPVDGESTYTFTNCRSAVVVADKEYTAVSQLLTYVTSVNSTGGKYIIFSFNPTTYPESAYSVTKPVGVYTIPSNWDLSDIEIQTPQINGMLPTGRNVKSGNLFPKAVNVGTGKYVDRIQNGKAVLVDNANYDTYLIPVDGSSVYSFTNCRTAVVVSDLQYTAVGTLLANTTSIDSTGGSYILFSFNPTTYPVDAYSVTKPVPQYAIPADWTFDDGAKQRYQIKSGSIASGGALSLSGKTAVKYGQRIAFKGFITTFSEITLAYYNYNNSAISNSIVVDGTSMIVYVGSSAVDTFTHGLTIANDISLIVDYLDTGVEITLESNGAKYKAQTTWERLTSGVVSVAVKSNGTVCTSAMLVRAIERVEKPIWYFGDSYISYTNPARWPYYLIQYKFDGNTLLNGYAGGTSAADMMAFEALLNYGTPKFAVFATGMNDNASTGGDTASEAAPAWVSARDKFLAICDANEITPIFCTVPTVPSVNNQKKNEWIRSSGYRYIDFAKAVGANADGEWYGNGTANDMLSSDKVHPTERGAVALFTQAITDFPEFLM